MSTSAPAPNVMAVDAAIGSASPREFYIDHLRTVLTVQVIVFHAAITYGSIGGWFYREVQPSSSTSSLLLSLFCITSQAYFMGFFFLLAGYFTPASLDRKGYARFFADRLLRLGIPLLVFGVLLGPVTIAMSRTADGRSFWTTIAILARNRDFINGPLWFAQALLIFAAVYAACRALTRTPLDAAARNPTHIPSGRRWFFSAIAVGASSVAIRIFFAPGQNFLGLQLAFFSSYVFLFVLGAAAWRHDWLRRLKLRHARWWIVGLAVLWPLMPVAIVKTGSFDSFARIDFSRGIPSAAIFWAMWEPFVAWGIIAALLLGFRKYMNVPSRLWSWLDRRAYTAYIIHPPVLVGVALLLRPWSEPALVKWACTGTIAVAACWLIADPLVRLPGLRRIV